MLSVAKGIIDRRKANDTDDDIVKQSSWKNFLNEMLTALINFLNGLFTIYVKSISLKGMSTGIDIP